MSAYQSRPEQQARSDKLYKLYYYFLNLELFAVLFLCSATLYLMAHDKYSPCIVDSRPQFFAWHCLQSAHKVTRSRTAALSVFAPMQGPTNQPESGLCTRRSADATPCRAQCPRQASCFARTKNEGTKSASSFFAAPRPRFAVQR